jgi:ferric-dicitrate binding protein FerR (iron transport regulator)
MNYNEVISSYLSGNATPEDKLFLNNWIKESPDNLAIFKEAKQVWIASSMLSVPGNYNNLKAYPIISSKIKVSDNQAEDLLPRIPEPGYRKILKIAAVLLLMVFIGGIGSFFITKSIYTKQAFGICFFEAPIGSRAIAVLPDGTKIWLNAGSRIEYSTNYNKQIREVWLTGEGFFKVKTNPEKPFFVKTNNLTIKATGTAFNVKAYPGEKQVTTTLVEGKVELKGKGSDNQTFSYRMKPNQKVIYFSDNRLFADTHVAKKKGSEKVARNEKEELPLLEKAPIVTNTDVKTELYTSWKDERWIIESETLGDLAVLFERRYNVSILFGNSEIKNYRFSATIQNETIEQIFEIMRFALPISYVAEKGKITLKTDKDLKNIYKPAYQKQ